METSCPQMLEIVVLIMTRITKTCGENSPFTSVAHLGPHSTPPQIPNLGNHCYFIPCVSFQLSLCKYICKYKCMFFSLPPLNNNKMAYHTKDSINWTYHSSISCFLHFSVDLGELFLSICKKRIYFFHTWTSVPLYQIYLRMAFGVARVAAVDGSELCHFSCGHRS